MKSNLTKMMRRVGHPTRLILVLSVLVVAVSIALAAIVVSGKETSPEAGSDFQGADQGPAVGSAEAGQESSTTALDAAALRATDDPEGALVAEACQQFRSGATVADFAVWFESGWDDADAGAVEKVFREAVEEALTEACPEVVPSD